MKFLTTSMASLAAMTVLSSAAIAQDSGTFTKKRYSIKGTWEIVQADDKTAIRFKDDFKTRNGPDLKVFLAKDTVKAINPRSVNATARHLSVLKSSRGEQTYILPDDVNLSDYKSVLIHCEAYSVLWGGFDIPE